MDTKALRQKVLDLAIRGKLVPQDPNNEPADLLLERIRRQKQQMVKEGKLKAKDIKNDTVIFVGEDNLHYEKFADGSVKCIEEEIPFELPDGWVWARIGALCIINPRNQLNDDTQVSFIPMPLICEGYANNHSSEHRIWKSVKSGFTHFAENDIGIAKITPCFENRKSVIFKDLDSGFGAGTTELHILRTLKNTVYPEYLLWIAKTDQFISGGVQTYTGAVGQQRVGKEYIANYLVPVPPREDQSKILAKIDTVFAMLSFVENEQVSLNEAIRNTKAKILNLAIRGQLVPQDPTDEPAAVLLERIRAEKEALIKQGKIKRDKKETIIFRGEDNSYYEKMADGKLRCLDSELPFELPDGWEWCNLSMIGFTNIGLTYRPTDIGSDGVMVLRSCNIVNNEIDLSDLVRVKTDIRNNQYAEKNDILICARNGSKALVGKCALVPDFGEQVSFGAFMAIYRTPFYEYVLYYLRSNLFRNVFDDGNSTAINQLTQDMLKRAVVPFPPIAEQHRIVSKIDALIAEINRIEMSLS